MPLILTYSHFLPMCSPTQIQSIMSNLLGSLDEQASKFTTFVHAEAEREIEGLPDRMATDVLLCRAALTAVTAIARDIPTFSHPYLGRILSVCLQLNAAAASLPCDAGDLVGDIDQCLSAAATRLPARLAIPSLIQVTPDLLASGHALARRFMQFLAEMWAELDRPAVLAHLSDLAALAALVLDYGRAFGDGSQAALDAEAAVSEAVVTLSLKLTEPELKTLLARLGDWRDRETGDSGDDANGATSPSSSWPWARSAAFYALLGALTRKLRSIFVPCVGPFWRHAADTLEAFVHAGDELTPPDGDDDSSRGRDSAKKAKKRKRADGSGNAAAGAKAPTLAATAAVVGVLECVSACCIHDSAGFMDEVRSEGRCNAIKLKELYPSVPLASSHKVLFPSLLHPLRHPARGLDFCTEQHRYSAIMPNVVALLSQRQMFSDDAAFLAFVDSSLSPCLADLATSATRDTLWKPLTHKTLMQTRDPRPAVRLASLKALRKLFVEVRRRPRLWPLPHISYTFHVA